MFGGWNSPTTTKNIPATIADNPAQRMRLDAVIYSPPFNDCGLARSSLLHEEYLTLRRAARAVHGLLALLLIGLGLCRMLDIGFREKPLSATR
jgi:hypothetical protein